MLLFLRKQSLSFALLSILVHTLVPLQVELRSTSSQPDDCSSFMIKLADFLTLGVSLCILALGIWLSTKHGDCNKILTVPVLILGVFLFIISLLGFVGTRKDLVSVFYLYLVIMFFLLVGLALFTAFAFIVTSEGAGGAISGQGFKEYKLGDYSIYIRRLLNNPQKWKHLQDCFINPDYCPDIPGDYQSTTILQIAPLNSIQSGCCQPPAECRLPLLNVTIYQLTSRSIPPREPVHVSNTTTDSNTSTTSANSTTPPDPSPPPSNSSSPPPPLIIVTAQIAAITNLTRRPIPELRVSTATSINVSSNLHADVVHTTEYSSQYGKYDDADCTTFRDDPNTKCFECNSCKAGIADIIRKDWRLVAVINIVVFLLLVGLYTFKCCLRRNGFRAKYNKV